MPSERKTSHQKDHRRFRRINYIEDYVQKGDYQKVKPLEVPHPQSFFCMIQGLFSKVKCDITGYKESINQSEKLVTYQMASFFSYLMISLSAEKERKLLLSPVLDQWIKKARGSRSAHLNRYILKSIKCQKTMKNKLDNLAFRAFKDHSILPFSQPSEHPKSYLL